MINCSRYVLLGFLLCSVDNAIATEQKVPGMYILVAQENMVPSKLFYAMILNETRSLVGQDGERKTLPWPWTINHRGVPHFFPTRDGAYKYAKLLVEKGDKQFDIGLGQVNWYWNGHRFKGLLESLEPYRNLSVSASILREHYDSENCGQWELAVGCYHRPGQRPKDKEIAINYTKRVIKIWKKI